MGTEPPVLLCPSPRGTACARYDLARLGPKPPCPFVNPCRFEPGGRLIQGMRVAITGATHHTRAELAALGDAAGLDTVGSEIRRVLVLTTLDAATAERTLLLVDVCLRGET